jgi:hypothetical protein
MEKLTRTRNKKPKLKTSPLMLDRFSQQLQENVKAKQ